MVSVLIGSTVSTFLFFSFLFFILIHPVFVKKDSILRVTPRRTNMTMENQPFEDVSPIKRGDFPASHASFPGSIHRHFSVFLSLWKLWNPSHSTKRFSNGLRQPKLRCCWAPPMKGLIKFHRFGATMIDKTSIGLASCSTCCPNSQYTHTHTRMSFLTDTAIKVISWKAQVNFIYLDTFMYTIPKYPEISKRYRLGPILNRNMVW